MRAFVELSENGKRAIVHFRYDEATKNAVKSVPGARFVPKDKGGPHWSLPLDIESMRLLRSAIGSGLELGQAINDWGKKAIKMERNLHSLAVADDWPIEDLVIAEKLPELTAWLRPYQRADVKFLATLNKLNLLEPRLGKTTETIAAIYEADLENGCHLVVAPQKSLDSVWRMEIERWTSGVCFTYDGTTKADEDDFLNELSYGKQPVWWLTTADMIRRGSFPDAIEWNSFTVDEYHKTGLANASVVKGKGTKFSQAVVEIPTKCRFALSGTPMGGKPIKIWGGLRFLNPDLFTSKWRWAGQWLEVEEDGGHKKPKGIKKGREDDFYKHLAPYATRRLREEVLPQLPPKNYIDVWCEMSPKQAKQYRTFAQDAEIRIDEYNLTANGILAEYTRLKQFANCVCDVEILGIDEDTGHVDMKVKATPDSGKLPYLMEKLAEVGIDPEDPDGSAQAIVASQFRETVEMIHEYLLSQGIGSALFTGKTPKRESERIQRLFKADTEDKEKLRVCCMVTTIGVGITLDNVESVHVFDETWVPDDQDQVTDRAINTSRLHQVNVLVYRSRGTIEEDIKEVNDEKFDTNFNVLDLRRRMFKEAMAK